MNFILIITINSLQLAFSLSCSDPNKYWAKLIQIQIDIKCWLIDFLFNRSDKKKRSKVDLQDTETSGPSQDDHEIWTIRLRSRPSLMLWVLSRRHFMLHSFLINFKFLKNIFCFLKTCSTVQVYKNSFMHCFRRTNHVSERRDTFITDREIE